MARVGTVAGFALFGAWAACAQNYTLQVLTSDGSVTAANTDPNLINGWGLSRSSGSPWWVSANGTGKSTLYDGTGAVQSLVVSIAGAAGNGTGKPSGTIYNGTQDFQIADGKPAVFLFASEDGTISGWNSGVDPANTIVKVNNPGAIYKGLTTAWVNGIQYLYAANFASGKIEIYDAGFNPVSPNYAAFTLQPSRSTNFLGPFQPAGGLNDFTGFVPYNIQNIGGTLFIAFAIQDDEKEDSVSGAGLGVVAAFTPTGRQLKIYERGSFLNAPWGLALAPSDFGSFSHCLLVSQFGSGQIVAFNLMSGDMVGVLADENNQPISIDGVWGIGFGNASKSGAYNTLYFTAGPYDENNGEFGSLTPTSASLTQGNDL